MSGAGLDDRTGSGGSSRDPGNVIPYDEFLRARAKRESVRRGPASFGDAPDAPEIADSRQSRSKFDHPDSNPSLSEGDAARGDTREQTVGEIRARIRDGFYDRPEILEETVQRILSTLEGFRELHAGPGTKW